MTLRVVLAASAALFLVACEGGGDPVEQAMRDASAERQAGTVKDGQVSSAPDHAAMGHDTPANGDAAFAASETAMHERMMAASGETLDQAYIAKMVEHHRGAVAMADVALAQSTDPEIRRMAQGVKDAQTREITEMRAWRPATASAN